MCESEEKRDSVRIKGENKEQASEKLERLVDERMSSHDASKEKMFYDVIHRQSE